MRRFYATVLALTLTPGLVACNDRETGGLPEAPTDLSAMFDPSSGVILRWSDASDEENVYVVERLSVAMNGDFVALAELPADTIMYTDTGVLSGGDYRYRVLAVNAYGESPSNEVMITVP